MRSTTGRFEFDIPCEEEQDACNLTRLSVTENGTYLPDPEDGYYQVDVNVSGIELLTRAQWNALTTAQKQAYGLVAIQDSNSGFDRGELVYGADYSEG